MVIIYRVALSNFEDSSCGFQWFEAASDAQEVANEWINLLGGTDAEASITEVEVDVSTEGIVQLLNRFADHPDNG